MCHYSFRYKYYDIKPIMHWRAEQHKRQRILRYEKTGFWGVGNKKEPSEKDSFIIA
jgi:hypothetical protein